MPFASSFLSAAVTPARARAFASVAAVLVIAGTVAGCTGTSDAANGGNASGSQSAAATVTAVSVPSGSVSGGTKVVLTGTGLDSITGVKFGDNAATVVVATSAKEMTVSTPASTNYALGKVDITLTDADASAAASGMTFEYASVSPIDAQMVYLLAHWQDRNIAEYGSLEDNDCVNFASQSLIARGWTQTADWWHTQTAGVDKYASAWISSTSMKKYFTAHPELATALTDDERDKVAIGDIVQFDWDNSGDRDHTGVVTRIEGSGADRVIYFAGHSLDSDFRSVDTAITTDHPGGTAYYWHLVA